MSKAYEPIEGHVWNPISKWPPNAECFCKSGKKFKKCCRNKVGRTCYARDKDKLRAALESIKSDD